MLTSQQTRNQRSGPEIGQALPLRPTARGPFPPSRPYTLKFPQPHRTVPAAGDQGFKHMRLLGTFQTQRITGPETLHLYGCEQK